MGCTYEFVLMIFFTFYRKKIISTNQYIDEYFFEDPKILASLISTFLVFESNSISSLSSDSNLNMSAFDLIKSIATSNHAPSKRGQKVQVLQSAPNSNYCHLYDFTFISPVKHTPRIASFRLTSCHKY